ncbi:hypothetical protein B4129_0644 [Bacillus safensis]|nr:hypothetical protein B4129_0644 [Bacillus safensis]
MPKYQPLSAPLQVDFFIYSPAILSKVTIAHFQKNETFS